MSVKKAIEDIKQGKIVLVYDFDDREKETDMTVASEFIDFEKVRTLRKDAGGLLCVTTPYAVAEEIGLPFLSDIFWDCSEKYPLLRAMAPTDIPYDRTKSSFGLTINERGTYTGITDSDRALTIKSYTEVLFSDEPTEVKQKQMGERFRAPGHVHLLNTSEAILKNRKGHTELCTALMIMAGVKPSATICEMMGDEGGPKSKEQVMKYAEEKGLTFVTGDEIIAAWEEFSGKA